MVEHTTDTGGVLGSNPSTRTMKYIITLIIIILIILGINKFVINNEPSVKDITPKLEVYLKNNKNCSGTVSIDHLSDISIGEYNKALKSWPIYASHKETCTTGRNTYTNDGLDSNTKKVPVAFARSTSSGIEVFLPDIYNNIANQVQDDMNNASSQLINEKINNLKCYTNSKGNYICE